MEEFNREYCPFEVQLVEGEHVPNPDLEMVVYLRFHGVDEVNEDVQAAAQEVQRLVDLYPQEFLEFIATEQAIEDKEHERERFAVFIRSLWEKEG